MMFLCPKCRDKGSICYDKIPGKDFTVSEGDITKDTFRCIKCHDDWTVFFVVDHAENGSGEQFMVKLEETC